MADEELNALAPKFWTSQLGTFMDYKLPINFQRIRQDIEDLEVYDDDVWICGFPKSGTTWTQEMVWCISNDLDFEAAKENLHTRFTYLERSIIFNDNVDVTDLPDIPLKSADLVKNMKRPRFIKSHLPWDLLPKQIKSFEKRPKIIYAIRNPMDTFVSYYYFSKLLGVYTGDIELLAKLFLKHTVMFSPYDDHILSFWKERNQPNVLCVKYEDMKTKLSSVIDLVAEFLGKTLPDDGKDALISHLSFESLKKKQTTVPIAMIKYLQESNGMFDKEGEFIRSGKSGGYRSEMSEEAITLFKKQFVDKFREAGLKFST